MTESGRLRFTPSCEAAAVRFERTEKLRGTHLRVDMLIAEVERTLTTEIELSSEGGALLFSETGTILYRPENDSAWRVVAPLSVTFVEGPSRSVVRVAKGEHEVMAVYWGPGSMPVLESWLEEKRQRQNRATKARGTQPIQPVYREAYDRFLSALADRDELAEHRIAAIVMEIGASIMHSTNSHSLAPAPAGISDVLAKLIETVRESAASPWPLKEAADFVGYSPFHFSRIFKAQIGIGFHEFVDRTRTEMAVQLLTTTDHPIDLVASEAGFGTAQGLRESVKEYLGLVPSELRSSPDE